MRLFQITAAITVIVLFSISGWTTIVVKLDLPELVEQSDTIIQGQVQQNESRWDNQKKLIFTDVWVRVNDVLKGTPQTNVTVRHLGGTVGSINMAASGMPVFRNGEDVILFLKRNPETTYHVVGMAQGKYEITNEFAAVNAFGIGLQDKKSGQVIEGGTVSREPVEIFKSRIRRLVK